MGRQRILPDDPRRGCAQERASGQWPVAIERGESQEWRVAGRFRSAAQGRLMWQSGRTMTGSSTHNLISLASLRLCARFPVPCASGA